MGSTAGPSSIHAPSPDRSNCVVVVGLGFAGLPTAVAAAGAGYEVVGLDIDPLKVAAINGREAASGVAKEIIGDLVNRGLLAATTDRSAVRGAAVIVIAVPTPIDEQGRPDERAVSTACRSVVENVSPGTLIVLQSTVMPGTTRRLLVRPLEGGGWVLGQDVFVVSSPERINPGDPVFGIANTPRLIAGATAAGLSRGMGFFGKFVDEVHAVPRLEVAELAKLVENTFRFINISFANEVAVLSSRLGISAWDVINAAATKPFGFMAHYPGPGIGGECIPVSPRYLAASAVQQGLASEIIPAAFRATDLMPDHVVDRCAEELGVDPQNLTGTRILVVGLAYKPNVADPRHSPAIAVIRSLVRRGAGVAVFDPLVTEIAVDGHLYNSVDLDGEWPHGADGADAAIVITPHESVDYRALGNRVGLILDTRNELLADATVTGRVVTL